MLLTMPTQEDAPTGECALHPERIYPTIPLRYEPDPWNAPDVVETFNCEAYAFNTRRHGWLPLYGRLSATRPTLNWPKSAAFNLRMPPSLRASLGLIRDGLVPIRKHEFGPHEAHIIAYDSYADHYFRLDENGIWSQKPGKRPATNRDDRGAVITDPERGHFDFRKDLPRGAISAHFTYWRMPDAGIEVLTEEAQMAVAKEWPNLPYEVRKLMEYGFNPQILFDILDEKFPHITDQAQQAHIMRLISQKMIEGTYDPLHYNRLLPYMSRFDYDR